MHKRAHDTKQNKTSIGIQFVNSSFLIIKTHLIL